MTVGRLPLMPRVPPASHLPLDAGSRLLVVSPHLDDAVMSCGELIAAAAPATVVTVFAGSRPAGEPLTEWDQAAGFCAGDDVVGWRREEDRQAMRALGCHAVWLEHLDAQYGRPTETSVLRHDLAEVIQTQAVLAVVIPLGLFHEDHRQASDAAVSLMDESPGVDWFCYEDAPYRTYPGLVQQRLAELLARGVQATPTSGPIPNDRLVERKNAAVACYGSQLRALCGPERPGVSDTKASERFWWLTRASSG